ncbi:Hypothetical protein SRAE_1000024900 [Strongyloides ratti]|uniref:Uncharacterized protein n=1 Tax=Strongyloides ratti TaxID=34506 RepID=A0A090MU41_STRRB|nr:Hypothetical protein SRAE_1000024900 [Strongyloides ratti]CEF61973.1 Hypothetical protein SRAE_1000024900 [Strongyloides ratti]
MEPYEDTEYIWTKRTFEDPRFYTASFGKRNVEKKNVIKNEKKSKKEVNMSIEKKKDDELIDIMDPRFYSTAFGKRTIKLEDLQNIDPRFFSSAYGKRSSYEMDDPRLFSAAFGK